MNHILITGGAGFIGSHVARTLLRSGSSVTVLDNFDPFYDPAIKRRNVESCAAAASRSARFQCVEGDFRDAATCARVVRDVDAVIHLGALAGVRPSIAEPVRYMDVNVVGTQLLLEAVRAKPSMPFVFASSSSVYGGNTKVPFAESDPVDHPVSPYAASKKAGEVVCHAHHHLHGNAMTCLRFFTVYGPGQRPEMAIHKFARHLLAGEAILFFGDGSTRRDYTYVDDIVDGVVAALQRADGYHVYNLGGSHTTDLATLVSTIESVFGKTAKLERLPEQPGDVRATWADTTLAERELGFTARVGLREGIERFAQWYREERRAARLR
ncbi:MAG: GDP-mannose 4,6-dehydratase [Planctomycetes bacterium]|nr:GDP-mannose 4,6-dehydratase [Planctomycetota bacterium]